MGNKSKSYKLDKFKNAVFSDAKSQADEIIRISEEKSKDDIDKALNDANEMVKRETAKIDEEVDRKIKFALSKNLLESKSRVIEKRQELIDNIFAGVKKQLEDFSNTDKYTDFILEKIKSAEKQYPNQKGIIYLRSKDMKFKDKFSSDKFSVRERESMELGGVMIAFESIGIILDNTFENALKIQEEQLIKSIGKQISLFKDDNSTNNKEV